MKRLNAGVFLGLFVAVAGVFLLLKNLGAFKTWGDAIWGGIFVLAGLVFLGMFVTRRDQWWRALAGTTLLGCGAVILLVDWRQIQLGDWAPAVVLFGIALWFWITAAAQADNWWAVIPAGVLTLLGLLIGLRARLTSQNAMLAAIFLGLAVVFGLAYLVRSRKGDGRWAAIPAVALLLMGLVSLVGTINEPQAAIRWWPIVLIVFGLGICFIAFARQGITESVTEGPAFPSPSVAPGASIIQSLPDAPAPGNQAAPRPSASPTTSQKPTDESSDIYKLISEQPQEPKKPDA